MQSHHIPRGTYFARDRRLSFTLLEMKEEEGAAAMSEDYSASATLIRFDRPIPLLRGPVPAGLSDDPSLGPFALAFGDAPSWRIAYRETESKVMEQCLAGARVGCAISASKKCSPPWWKSFFGPPMDLAERERCEEREMEACLAAAREPCVRFAREKCLPVFRDARIVSKDLKHNPRAVGSIAKNDISSPGCDQEQEFTNFRGSVLLQASAETKEASNKAS